MASVSLCVWSPENASGQWWEILPKASDICIGGYCYDGPGLKDVGDAIGVDMKAVVNLTGNTALDYFLPGSSSVVNSLYQNGRTSDSKIVEILKTCNWKVNQRNADIVINAISNNRESLKSLLQAGGIRHTCKYTSYWGL